MMASPQQHLPGAPSAHSPSSSSPGLNFGSTAYWEKRYGGRAAPYEWACDYADIRTLLHATAPRSRRRMLLVGCGDSPLSAAAFDDGWTSQVNVDSSRTVIERMRALHARGRRAAMQWRVLDVMSERGGLRASFGDESFGVVVDKCLFDTIACAPHDRVRHLSRLLRQYDALLRPGGVLLLLSLNAPDEVLPYTDELPGMRWVTAHARFVGADGQLTTCVIARKLPRRLWPPAALMLSAAPLFASCGDDDGDGGGSGSGDDGRGGDSGSELRGGGGAGEGAGGGKVRAPTVLGALRIAPSELLAPHTADPPAALRHCADSGRCTFIATGQRYSAQRWFTCSCNGHREGTGCCAVCAVRCHAGEGHDLREQPPADPSFCDCGFGGALADQPQSGGAPAFPAPCRCLGQDFADRQGWFLQMRA